MPTAVPQRACGSCRGRAPSRASRRRSLPVVGLKLDLRHSSSCWPQRLLASSTTSFRSSTLGSNWDSGRDVLDEVVALAGLDLGGDAGRDLGLVDVVDGDVDPDLLAPVLGELVEPLVVAGHEVAPQQDLQVTGELGPRLGEADRRRLAGRLLSAARAAPARLAGAGGHRRPQARDPHRPQELPSVGCPQAVWSGSAVGHVRSLPWPGAWDVVPTLASKERFTQVRRAYAFEIGSQVPAGTAGGSTSTLRPRPVREAMPRTPAHSSGGQPIP